MINYSPPTEKQIDFANKITVALNIDFPTCSAEYTKFAYQQFISTYYNEYTTLMLEDPVFYDDDEMSWWDPFAEGGY